MTENQIAARDAALAALPEEYDTNEGSVFWNIVSALAVPCGDMLDVIDTAIEQKDPANLEGDDLDVFVSRYGMARNLGAAAGAVLTVTLEESASVVDIPGGTLFETEDGLQYAADDDFSGIQNGGTITVTALENGEVYNVAADAITVIPIAIEGVESVSNSAAASGGVDIESDGDLFERWQIQVGYIQTGYNKAWYEAKALEMPSVGYARAYAAGETVGSATVPANTVYVIVLDDANLPLDAAALAAVQEALDPSSGGIGAGIAPPTARVVVRNGDVLDVAVSIGTLTIDGTYSAQEVQDGVEDLLQQELGGLQPGGTIYYAQMISAIMAADGVVNVDGVTLNGTAASVALEYDQVATLQEVTYGTVTTV
ncbi:MAG: baseplate J/gp47 family protein [Eubacteriales bacterium]|nr:baseplate J/gp47 family protein [Eubacteriales bacterium]